MKLDENGKPQKAPRIPLEGHDGCFSEDARRFVTYSSYGRDLWIYRNSDGRLLWRLADLPVEIREVAFYPDGRSLLVYCEDEAVRTYRRCRNELWWRTSELWATLLFASLLCWSILRDRRALAGSGV